MCTVNLSSFVGRTRVRAGYKDIFPTRRLTVFWNNRVNGRKVISSASVVGVPGRFANEPDSHACSQYENVQNSASCFLPTNNGHIMIWEEGSRLSGYLVKDGAFDPILGTQSSAKVLYNSKESRAFVVYQQVVSGSRVLFVKNIAPGRQSSCTSCAAGERCAMKDVCLPRNAGTVSIRYSFNKVGSV